MKTSHLPLATAKGIQALEQKLESLRFDLEVQHGLADYVGILRELNRELFQFVMTNDRDNAMRQLKESIAETESLKGQLSDCRLKHLDAMEIIKDERERGDEWKRRAKSVYKTVDIIRQKSVLLEYLPEAAEWFEDKDRAKIKPE